MAGEAFGTPGIAPTWTSSAKDLVTTALGPSRLWATIGHGIVNEVYWPATGRPQLRDLGFLVAGERGWYELKRVNRYSLTRRSPAVPLVEVVHTGDGYRVTLEYLPDPARDVLLISYRLDGDGFALYPLLAPHLGSSGYGNTAWTTREALCATDGEHSLCLRSDSGYARASAGYVGSSDGWQDFAAHGAMTWEFERAADGNVALIGELPTAAGVLALSFAESPEGAATLASSALAVGPEAIRPRFIAGWERWAETLELPELEDPELAREAWISATVLKAHEDRTYPGAVVASLSIPWGNAHNDSGGYHLVWARDAVETALALLAIGDTAGAERMLGYLIATQSDDGHWRQNFYPDGRPFWGGVQLDEVGFPILLAAKLREHGLPETASVEPMVHAAATYLAGNGPVSPQDRWEENPGASPFTLAVEVAALVAAAEWLAGEERDYALALADCWNERIEDWTYVTGTQLAEEHGVTGYYVRIGPSPEQGGLCGRVEVRNRNGECVPAAALVGLDFLYLARLGLRSMADARMRDTLAVADALLRVETPNGVTYRRYPGDGYGEHADGSPFDGSGIGRPWPLLAGERGHGELLATGDPSAYLRSMARLTGPGGLIPEQVWDAEPIPERELYPGRPSGSAMPLVWAHAEFLKLACAHARGPVELLEPVLRRWQRKRPQAETWFWRDSVPFSGLPAGRSLVIESGEPFTLHFGIDGWRYVEERDSLPLGLGMHGVRLDARELAGKTELDFTRRYRGERWEGADHTVKLD